jgi:hypothetical protein
MVFSAFLKQMCCEKEEPAYGRLQPMHMLTTSMPSAAVPMQSMAYSRRGPSFLDRQVIARRFLD